MCKLEYCKYCVHENIPLNFLVYWKKWKKSNRQNTARILRLGFQCDGFFR